MAKLTPWFNARKQPPVNGDDEARYEHRCDGHDNRLLLMDIAGWVSLERKKWIVKQGRLCPHCEWRGLASPPNGTKHG
jgi:hypothetical protein